MQWINRNFAEADALPDIQRVLVPDGHAPGFWNAAIDEIVHRFRNGYQLPDCATVPMLLHGTIHVEHRHHLCAGYLYASPAELRAYCMLRLIGQLSADGTFDHRFAKDFRLSSAVWVDQHPIVIDNEDVGAVVNLNERWALILAALFQLSHRGVLAKGRDGYYEGAVRHCKDGGSIETVALGSGLPIGRGNRTEAEWLNASAALSDADQAPLFLGRLFFNTLCVRLFIVFPEEVQWNDSFLGQCRHWLAAVVAAATPGPEADAIARRPCTAYCGAHVDRLKALFRLGLCQLTPFGGEQPLDPGEAYPAVFRPFDGRRKVSDLDDLLNHLGPAHQDTVTSAYLLAALVVDRMMDVLRVRIVQQGALGAGFDWRAYSNLVGLMGTTRRQLGWRHLQLPKSATRLQLQRHFVELSREDERFVGLVRSAVADAPPVPRNLRPRCTLCELI